MKRLRWAAIPLVIWLLSGIARIGPEERAVVKRFGRIVARPGPGLWVGFPWGIDRITRVQLAAVHRVQIGYVPEAADDNPEIPAGQLLTGDQNLVNIQLAVDYSVADAERGLDHYLLNRPEAEFLIRRQAESALTEWIASHKVDDVLLIGNAAIPGWIMSTVQPRLDAHRTGIRLQQVSVVWVAPPEEVRTAFEEVNNAQNARRTKEEKALEKKEQRLQTARGTKYQFEQAAKAAVVEKLAEARAEAETFENRRRTWESLRRENPDLLRTIWWEEIGQMLSGMKGRGRVDVLDAWLGADGIDIMQAISGRKR
jgi:modulator of FtsH protease HflK